jgi:hypothetical protein
MEKLEPELSSMSLLPVEYGSVSKLVLCDNCH